jgi:hypothetical protein
MRRLLVAAATLGPVVLTAIAGLALEDRIAHRVDAEPTALVTSKGLAWREGPTLKLRMDSGAVLALTDRTACGDLPCPDTTAARFRYVGWDERAGGYRLMVGARQPIEMILPWDAPWDRPTFVDAAHAPSRRLGPLPLPDAPPDVAPDVGMVDWLAQNAAGRDPVEMPRLAGSAGRASRQGSALTIRLENKRKFVFTDDLPCGQALCPPEVERSFEYLGSSGDGRYQTVADHWYEGGDTLLIDVKSGAVVTLVGAPVFAPDGKRVAASMADPETPAPRSLEIWSLDGTAPKLDFSVEDGAGSDFYEIVGWDDADHLAVKRGPWGAPQRIPVMLAHQGASWHLEGGN